MEDAKGIEDLSTKASASKSSDSDSVGSGDADPVDIALQPLEATSDNVNTFEDLLKICGEAGWWQLRVFMLASFCGFVTALHNLAYAFIGATPPHSCKLPVVENISSTDLKSILIPRDKNGEYDMCTSYVVPMDNNGVPWTSETIRLLNLTRSLPCVQMDFSTSIFQSTIVTEFNLACGSQPLASAIQAIYMIGILIGSPIFGSISDKFGRRRAISIASFIFIVAGPLVALAPNFPVLMLARLILGVASPGVYATSFVLAVESVGPSWRGLVGNLFCIPFAFGYMALAGVAYIFRDWRTLQLVLCAPTLLQIFACWLSHESPRWLLSKGKLGAAEDVLRSAAAINGRTKYIPREFSELVKKVAGTIEEKPSVSKTWGQKIRASITGHARLFRTPRLRTRTLVLYFCWSSISMVYYGVALNSPNLSADRYLYTFISGVLEIPSYAMVPPLIKFLGRRKVFSGFLLLCGLSLMGSLMFAQGSTTIIALALFGKLLIGAAYSLIYLYATEVMPTLLRTFGVGSASMVGRIGSASAPFIVDLMGVDNRAIPTLVFGIVSLLAGCISLLLPETKNKRLPETIADVENKNYSNEQECK